MIVAAIAFHPAFPAGRVTTVEQAALAGGVVQMSLPPTPILSLPCLWLCLCLPLPPYLDMTTWAAGTII